jgi:hypothetical protein
MHTVYAASIDNAGNKDSVKSAGFKIDKTAPTISFVEQTPAPNGNGWNNTSVTLEWSCTDGTSGVSAPSVFQTVTSEGENQQATGTCTDLAGNTSSSTDGDVDIDTTNPTIVFFAATTAPNSNGWYKTDVTLQWNCSDTGSGVVNASVFETITTEGINQSKTGTCVDLAGNSSSSTDGDVDIDKTAPNAPSANVNPPPNGAGWHNSVPVTVSFTQNGDTGTVQSGIDFCTPNIVFNVETSGSPANGTCTDKAGNESAPASVTVKIDLTKPLISGNRTPAANGAGWNNTDVTVSFACADTGTVQSGIATDSVAGATLAAEGADQSVTNTGQCIDAAGNVGDPATVSGINIDKTSPTITGGRLPLANANGWNNTNVTVSFTCTDGLSGLAAGSPPLDTVLSSEGAGQSVGGTCYDKAGNSASTSVGSINIDKTAPTVTPGTPPADSPYLLNQVVSPSFSCNDALSGFTSAGGGLSTNGPNGTDCTGPGSVDTSSAGPASYGPMSATDRAGNLSVPSAAAYNVYYEFGGLQSPYGPPDQKSFKIKSAIPLKWQYEDASGNVVDSADAAPMISIIGPYACGAAQDGEAILVNDSGSSGLRYEADIKTWHFNWKTTGLQQGCYNIYIKSGDSGQTDGPFPAKLVR